MSRTLSDFTDADVARLEHLCAALDDGLVAFVWDDKGRCSLATQQAAEPHLVELAGGKSKALHRAKAVAKQHGRTVPRSLADALGDPVLVALSAGAA